ncbi:TVP38/TMEM64 family protein [Mycobacterium lepraemurium]|nr:TVP38/TMEM64 family protein [Mycobacterium lepraemurium]
MDDQDAPDAPASRRAHILRLAVFTGFLAVVFYLVAVARVIDVGAIRAVVSATGPAAPLTYVVVSAFAGALFVPGSILAAGSGLLFGPLLGVFVTLGATVGTATAASFVGRRADRVGVLWAVVGLRFVPGISDALASYPFGTFGVPLWKMAVGAFIGSAPRAFAYTALGASVGNRSSLLAYAAVAVWCVSAIVGAFATHRGYRTLARPAQGRGALTDRRCQRAGPSIVFHPSSPRSPNWPPNTPPRRGPPPCRCARRRARWGCTCTGWAAAARCTPRCPIPATAAGR